MQKILIIEDDQTIAKELKELLDTSGYESIILEEVSNVLEKILHTDANLILLDINLPEMNGELLLKEFRKHSNLPVIMVTSRNSETDEVLSMSYGADDYITKPYNPTILLLRIANLLKRASEKGENYKYKDLTISPEKGLLSNGTSEILLTKNEMIIFSYLLLHPNRIVTRDELMTTLWNNNEYINDNALTVNISRLRAKLKEIGHEEAIETRKNQGYILL